MESFWVAMASEPFLQNAILGGILASIVCGVVGPFIYVRQIGYIAGAMAHTVLGGMGMIYYFGGDPFIGALLAALFAALVIGWVGTHAVHHEDTIINALWASGMAVGIIFIFKTPGYDVQLMSYLFGNILMITTEDLRLMLILGGATIGLISLFYKRLVAITFDEEFARLRGIKVNYYYYLLLILIAITTVLLVQIVGLILVITLFVIPAATAAHFFRSLGAIILGAISFGLIFTQAGLYLSYGFNLPTGAMIILLMTAIYLLVIIQQKLRITIKKRKTRTGL